MMKIELIKHFVEMALKTFSFNSEVTIQTDYRESVDCKISGEAVVVGDGEFVIYNEMAEVEDETIFGKEKVQKEVFKVDVATYYHGSYNEPPDVDIQEFQFDSLVGALDSICKRILDNEITILHEKIDYTDYLDDEEDIPM